MKTFRIIKRALFLFTLIFFGLFFLRVTPVFTEELKTHCQIITFMPDFYRFWEEAKDQTLEKKIVLWDSIFEAGQAAGSEWYIVEQDLCQRPPMESIGVSLENLRKMGVL